MVHFDGNDTYIHYITCYCVRVSAGVQDFVKGAWGETRFEDAVGSELTGWRRSKPQWGAGRNRGRQDILLLQQKGGGQMRVQGGTLTYFFSERLKGEHVPPLPPPPGCARASVPAYLGSRCRFPRSQGRSDTGTRWSTCCM